jgi:hypothetical protein
VGRTQLSVTLIARDFLTLVGMTGVVLGKDLSLIVRGALIPRPRDISISKRRRARRRDAVEVNSGGPPASSSKPSSASRASSSCRLAKLIQN